MSFKRKHIRAIAALALSLPAASQGQASAERPLLQDSFRIGSGGGALCQAQSATADPAARTMFDRAWTVVCRDAAIPVGQVYSWRTGAGESDASLLERLAISRKTLVTCSAAGGTSLPNLGAVSVRNCTAPAGTYRILSLKRGGTTYAAQGLAVYGSALDLALRTVVRGRVVPGQVDIVTTGGGADPRFARLQAATLDPQTVLAEGYRRNASGNYAEAAEFFDSLTERLARDPDMGKLTPAERTNRAHEYLINRALQLSNQGLFDQADAAFSQARAMNTADAVQLRLRRNFDAMHHINQQDLAGAREILDRALQGSIVASTDDSGAVALPVEVAVQMSSAAGAQAMGVRQDSRLSPQERAAILDAQAGQLRGTILRLSGQPGASRAVLARALDDAVAIRGGRVTSIARLRAQLLGEIALTYEAEGNFGAAESNLQQSLALIAAQYPDTMAVRGARARLAAFLARRGRTEEALTLYRSIIASTMDNHAVLTGMQNQLLPYFELLAAEIPERPDLAGDLFLASQLLVRPGAAETLEQLTRELSAGGGDAARLFRQSLSLSRDIERGRIAEAQLREGAEKDASLQPQIAAQQAEIDRLAAEQATTLAALGAYPQYRAVSPQVLTLKEMQGALRPGEAYFKLARLGDAFFAIWVDQAGATGYRVAASATEVARKVKALRETISLDVNGAQTTYALDVPTARALYLDLFAPVEARLAGVRHLIVEPDAAMLQLPVNLLIASQPGVDAYEARVEKGGDEFDFRGIGWLGREHAVSTALSARAFRDARLAAPSNAAQSYIGFGDNAPLIGERLPALTRSAIPGSTADCNWSPLQWSRPIPATELRQAAQAIGGQGNQLVTGAAFTDEAVLGRGDLDNFRILHFATHGLVTPPHPGCPARPALLTSFAPDRASDGLLQFGEIFDMRLNADLVVLSACDTAGEAGVETTRAAGLAAGGGALDGLVRAFIGAGSRSVIASHWPAPEEFQATERLIGGLFAAAPDQPMAEALRAAQIKLMDDPATSHPFYWSGFAIIGDGARPLISRR
ncbi:CHAT domain-containing protein [Sphingobium bisphenolivorans]|uniref:CHAT domain-containing protein n=1 Tax=Sphingobium bisphenolivorans TaxID=1335760 RepID=UPI0003B3BB47|nr:CHAT domain-containing protein [Sphingobium bisphenolivorans]